MWAERDRKFNQISGYVLTIAQELGLQNLVESKQL